MEHQKLTFAVTDPTTVTPDAGKLTFEDSANFVVEVLVRNVFPSTLSARSQADDERNRTR